MKRIIYFLTLIFIPVIFVQCKKSKTDKLENPFGLLLLGSDTTLQDGRYVIRTKHGCNSWASTLLCDYTADEVLGINGSLWPVDHILYTDIDSSQMWYVKKVRYVSPDPDYALAFGYRIYQRTPDGNYRFLSFTSTSSTTQWTDDEIGFSYGDGGSKSVKAGMTHLDYYPADPPVPTYFATDTSTTPKISTRYLFQLFPSEENQGAFNIKSASGLQAYSGASVTGRWSFCMAFWNNNGCEVNDLYPHFRSGSPKCEGWHENGEESRRCYITDYFFQKVY